MLTAAALAFLLNIAGGVFNWIFQKAGRLTTQVVLFALALIGAGWGAISDQESIVGGAMKGAFVGAGIRTGMRGLNIKSTRGLTKFNNARGFRENLSRSWKIMSESKNRNLRNMIVGVGAFQGVRGMMSGRDNPLGGGVSGGIAGGLQGAALYGGYRGIKSMGFFK